MDSVRTSLIVVEIVVGIGAASVGARMLNLAMPGRRTIGTPRWAGTALLALLGLLLIAAAALVVVNNSRGRLVSVEAGVLFTGWVLANLSAGGVRHWLQPVALALGLATVVLGFLLSGHG
ncbi:MAG: hypothetical protein M1274_10140 [Actinobacteria bacterium]|nr:hypothetical protein [Actinomycetota bacterium]